MNFDTGRKIILALEFLYIALYIAFFFTMPDYFWLDNSLSAAGKSYIAFFAVNLVA